jgi:hypothetical protein
MPARGSTARALAVVTAIAAGVGFGIAGLALAGQWL